MLVSAFLALFRTNGDLALFCSKKNVLKELPDLFSFFVLKGSFPGGLIH